MSNKLQRLILGVCLAATATPAVADNLFQDFETWPRTGTFATTTNGQWVANKVWITGLPTAPWGSYTGTNAANLPPWGTTEGKSTNSFLLTPLLTNGVGTLSFYAQNRYTGSSRYNYFTVQKSYNGTQWSAPVTNWQINVATWTQFSCWIGEYSNVYVRIRKTGETSATPLGIDAISVTNPPAYVIFSGTTNTPRYVSVGEPAHITNVVRRRGLVADMGVKTYWRHGIGASSGDWSGWSSVVMTNLGGNAYRTFTPIPGLDVTPGTRVQYYVEAVFNGPGKRSPMYDPPAASNSPYFYTVRQPPTPSQYSKVNLEVLGRTNATMYLTPDRDWRRVTKPLTPWTDPQFRFVGAATNGVTTNTWGDADQAISNLAVYGHVELAAGPMIVKSTHTNWLAFTVNESNLLYSAENCAYVNFDGTWPAGSYNFGTKTNSEGWINAGGRRTDAGEVSKAFRGAGSSALLPETAGTQFIRSPYLPAGIGEISLWYRNGWFVSDIGKPTGFYVEKSVNGTTWHRVATVENVYSPDYLHFSMFLADRDYHYVRILNSTNSTHARLLVDEVTVTEPVTGVSFAGLAHSPPDPDIASNVYISVSITPLARTSNLTAQAWCRAGTSGDFFAVPMTNAGAFFRTATHVPKGIQGIIQYYVQCDYSGFAAAPGYAPATGRFGPAAYTNRDAFMSFQNFETWPASARNWGSHTNGNWLLWDGKVVTSNGYHLSVDPPHQATWTNAAWFRTVGSWLRTPRFGNGVGSMKFYCKNRGAPSLRFRIEAAADPAGLEWRTLATRTNTTTGSFTEHYLAVNTNGPVFLRFVPLDSPPAGQHLGIDNITLTYTPSMVAISNVVLHPGYPGPNDEIEVSALIAPVPTVAPAFNLRGRLWYRIGTSGPFTSIPMTLSGDFLRTSAKIAGRPAGTVIQYYVEGLFNGYYHEARESHSPTFCPPGRPGVSQSQYYLAPTNAPYPPLSYTVRKFDSEHNSMSVTSNVGTAQMELVNEHLWQCVMDLSSTPTNRLQLSFAGVGRYTNWARAYGQIDLIGDPAQSRFSMPQASYGAPGGDPIVADGDFSTRVVFRYNSANNRYSLARGAYQTFNEWEANQDKFEESLDRGDITVTSYGFDGWRTNRTYYPAAPTNLANFEQWSTSATYQVEQTGPDGWVIHNSLVLQELNKSEACRMREVEDLGDVRPGLNNANFVKGVGTFTFNYRCTYADDCLAYYKGQDLGGVAATNWRNYAVRAEVTVTDKSPMWPYISMFARYQNSSNYYEYRLEQLRDSEAAVQPNPALRVSLWRRRAGAEEQIASSTAWLANLVGTHFLTLIVCTNNEGYVYLEGQYNDVAKVAGYQTAGQTGNSYDTDAAKRILAPGTIGFYAKEADLAVDEINVFEVDVQRFEFWGKSSVGTYTNARWRVVNGQPLLNGTDYYCLLARNTQSDSDWQKFDTWKPDTTWRTYTTNGWKLSDARVASTNAWGWQSASNSVWLRYNTATTNTYLRTPLISQGLSWISFYCKNVGTNSIRFEVQTSSNDVQWLTVRVLTNTSTAVWAPYTVTLEKEYPVYARIVKKSMTSLGQYLGIDDVTPVKWPNRGIYSPRIGYEVGRMEFRYMKDSGLGSARIGVYGSANGTNWTQMDLFTDESGSMQGPKAYTTNSHPALATYKYFRVLNSSTGAALRVDNIYVTEKWKATLPDEDFQTDPSPRWVAPKARWRWNPAGTYERKGYVGPLISFAVQSKATGGGVDVDDPLGWTTKQTFTATNLSYLTGSVDFKVWNSRYVRVQHTSGQASLVVDNLGYSSWRDTPWLCTNGWSGSEVWVASNATEGTHVELWRSRAPPAPTNQFVMTPWLATGVEYLSFDIKAVNPPITFQVRRSSFPPGATNNFATVVTNVTWNKSGWTNFTVFLRYTNAMFLRIQHTTAGSNSIMFVDNVQVKDYKPRDANTWSAYNALITPKQNVREFETNATRRTCYLNNSATADTVQPYYYSAPFVQSAHMPFGIGEISFWHRRWTGSGDAAASIYFKASATDTNPPQNWTSLGSLTGIRNTNYVYFTTNVFMPGLRYLRIIATTNASVDRVCVDNVLVTEPIRSDFAITNLGTIPAVPLDSDNVKIRAEVTGFVNYPTNIRMRAYYHVGDDNWGNWTKSDYLTMARVTNGGASWVYAATSGIPKQATDQVVQYTVAALWDGVLAPSSWAEAKEEKRFTTPSWYYPVDLNRGQSYTNPYYIVFSCSTGAVWINEFNVWDGSGLLLRTNQYVELCGKAGSNISNWWLEVMNPSFVTTALYRIRHNSILANETKGYGFWVVGSNHVTGVDQYLTNALPDEGGVRLRRGMGAIVDAVCWGQYEGRNMDDDPSHRFKYVGDDDGYADYPVMLTGTGTVASDFRKWVTNKSPYSPNGENAGQSLLDYAATQTLSVASARGVADPSVGLHEYGRGTWLSCRILDSPVVFGADATQYVCVGWTPGGNVPLPGANPTNTGPFMLQVDSSIAWTWRTNLYLGVGVSGNGSVNRTGWFRKGTNLTVTATAAQYNRFSHWSGDTNGCTIVSNALTVTMTRPRSPVTAHFASTDKTLAVSSARGMAVPGVGVHTNHYNDLVTCSVTNIRFSVGTTQYVCLGWAGTGSVPPMPAVGSAVTLSWQHAVGYPNWPDTYAGQNGSGWIVAMYADGGNRLRDAAATNGASAGDDFIVTNSTVIGDSTKVFWTTAKNVKAASGREVYTVIFNSTSVAGATHYLALTNGPAFFNVPATNATYNCGTARAAEWKPLAASGTVARSLSTGPFRITADSTIAWAWRTNCWLAVAATGSGTVDRTSGWMERGTNVTLNPQPLPGYTFQSWAGDTNGCVFLPANALQAPMTRARSITAQFSAALPQYTVYGTPYAWLQQYYASNLDYWDTNDSDWDGMLGWMEHVTGTIPTNHLSVFHVLDVLTYDGSNMVSWYGTTNSGVTNAWSMYRSTNLMKFGNWILIVTSSIPRHPSGTNVWWDLQAPVPGPAFYRPMVIWTNGP